MNHIDESIEGDDHIDTALRLRTDEPMMALRASRPAVKRFLQQAGAAVLEAGITADFSAIEREAVGLRVAVLHRALPAYARHRSALGDLGIDELKLRQIEADVPAVGPRLAAVLAHVDLLTLRPAQCRAADLDRLRQRGLSERAIVTLTQLVGYLNFEIRLVTGLQLLREHPAGRLCRNGSHG